MIALSIVWGFLKRVPWQAWAVLALIGALAYFSHTRYRAGYDAAMQETAELKAEQDLAFQVMARNQERAHAEELASISSKFILERAKGYEQRDQVISDLRAGAVRVRDKFRCKASLPDPAPAPAEVMQPQKADFLTRMQSFLFEKPAEPMPSSDN